MQCAKQLGCPNAITLPSWGGSEISAFQQLFPRVLWSSHSLCYQGCSCPTLSAQCVISPCPDYWQDRLSVQQRCAHCHSSPLSQKHLKIQMDLLRKSWIIFHLLLHSGETKWNKIIYRRQLYPILLTRHNESLNSWNNSSDFELISKRWADLKKQNAI